MAIALLVTLFAMAALAVDLGFLYTRSRMLYAVADAEVAAGMGDIVAGNGQAVTDVNNLATKYAAAYTIVPTPSATQLSVKVSATYPLYFGGILGFHSRTLSVTAIGQGSPRPPALLALGGCGTGAFGLVIGGGANMTINGDVESNGILTFSTGLPGAQNVTGSAQSPCAGSPNLGGSGTVLVAGGTGSNGPFPDPFATVATSLPPCKYGSLAAPYSIPNVNWGPGGVLAPGVYCSGGALNASSIDPCNCMVANGVTFIALGDITMGDNSPSSITPDPSMPFGIVAYSAAADDCGSGGQSINVGFQTFDIEGSIYAPNGCINAGANTNITVNGSLIAKSVQIGAGGTWTLGSTGGGGGTTWRMIQ
jgi:hypothetical protein